MGAFAVALTRVINHVQSNRQDGIEGPFTCSSGVALDTTLIEKWKTKKFINIEGFRSSSLDLETAKYFAVNALENEKESASKNGSKIDKKKVILKITIENKNEKCYICMDREDYTAYLDEKEVLLSAGLKAVVKSVEVMEGDFTVFNLYISDASVKREQRKRTIDYAIPVIIYGV